jgi:DNA-binding transcriptional regulator LsrR (DeoR family)
MNDKRYNKKIKAAHLIYKERLPLQDVAKMLVVSRPTLAKMIDEMLQEEIVSIQIKDPQNYAQLVQMGYEIKKRYRLRDVIVTNALSSKNDDIIDSIGAAGADYLQDFLKSGMRIGTTGGKTIYALVKHLPNHIHINDIKVVTTTGGSLYANTKYHSNTIAQRLAEIYGGIGHFIYAPSYTDNLKQKNTLMQNSQIQSTLNLCKSVDIALTGIGNPESAKKYLPHPVDHWFTEAPFVDLGGAVNTLLIDKRGMPFRSSVTELSIGLFYEDLKQINPVIALAGGSEKYVAIKAALLGGYIDVLITDQGTASYLIENS